MPFICRPANAVQFTNHAGYRADAVLMPSTPLAWPHVVPRCSASFRVVNSLLSQFKSVLGPGSIPGSSTRKSWSGPKALASFLLRQDPRQDPGPSPEAALLLKPA